VIRPMKSPSCSRVPRISHLLRWAALLIPFSVSGCMSGLGAKRAEPSIVAVYNQSGGNLTRVSLSERRETAGQSVRLATISPVLMGTTQMLVRPADPPPLPLRVDVSWIDAYGNSYSRQVSLSGVLKGATGASDEALVFSIGPRGVLEVARVEGWK